jgi:hypothetical protein
MIQSFATLSLDSDSDRAGTGIAEQAINAFDGSCPDAFIVFASPQHDPRALLAALRDCCPKALIVGSTSAGEFTQKGRADGAISVLALRSSQLRFSIGIGRDVSSSAAAAAHQVVASFDGLRADPLPYRAALVMTDALAGYADALVEELTLATRGDYAFFGGGAGDDGKFAATSVFANEEVLSNAVVALEIQSMRPIGIGVAHGWAPAGPGLRVTEAHGMRVVGLNGAPAVDAFIEHAEATGQQFDRNDPLPFFLHNALGIAEPEGHRLRVPLAVLDDGAVACAAEIPEGAVVHFMKTTSDSAIHAAEAATRAALNALGPHAPAAALVFDCVATRLRIGTAFEQEIDACSQLLQPAAFVGCNTYGQIARAHGQFEGFHNCTAVVCVFGQ